MKPSLDPRTEERLRELFAGKVCARCGEAATRFASGRYFCADCFPTTRTKSAEAAKVNVTVVRDPLRGFIHKRGRV